MPKNKYQKIKNLVKKTNSVVLNSYTIAGEGLDSVFTWTSCLTV